MTDVKKYLSQIRRYDSRINAKLEECDRLKAMMTKVTPTLRDVPSSGSGGQDKISDAMAKLPTPEDDPTAAAKTALNGIVPEGDEV